MNIYAIVVTYNAMNRNWADTCLNSLQHSSVPVHAIVIDNNSTDDTVAFVRNHYPDTICLPQNRNLGFGQANNLGLKYAIEHDAHYVLLLNQDAVIHENTIQHLLNHSRPNALLSPVHLNKNGDALDKVFCDMLKRSNQNIIEQSLINHQVEKTVEVGMVCAACWWMSIDLVKKIGGFNPFFFHYGEDDNYYQRLKFNEIPTILITDAYMNHDRKIQGNMEMFNKKRLRRDMLLIFTDINLKKSKQLKEWLRILKKCYFNYLPKRKYFIGAFTYESFRLLFKCRKIQRSRKMDKQQGLIWLNGMDNK